MKYNNNIKTINNRLAPFYSNQYIVPIASSAYFNASQRLKPVAHSEIQESPAVADKPARCETMPKTAAVRR